MSIMTFSCNKKISLTRSLNINFKLKNINPAPVKVLAMRHGVRTKRLGRPADQRKAIIRSLVTQVLTHGTIKTTATRARYIRKYVDKMITLSKKRDLNSRRKMEEHIYNKALVNSIMEEAPERYAD